jgi:hypothetical protein
MNLPLAKIAHLDNRGDPGFATTLGENARRRTDANDFASTSLFSQLSGRNERSLAGKLGSRKIEID